MFSRHHSVVKSAGFQSDVSFCKMSILKLGQLWVFVFHFMNQCTADDTIYFLQTTMIVYLILINFKEQNFNSKKVDKNSFLSLCCRRWIWNNSFDKIWSKFNFSQVCQGPKIMESFLNKLKTNIMLRVGWVCWNVLLPCEQCVSVWNTIHECASLVFHQNIGYLTKIYDISS